MWLSGMQDFVACGEDLAFMYFYNESMILNALIFFKTFADCLVELSNYCCWNYIPKIFTAEVYGQILHKPSLIYF